MSIRSTRIQAPFTNIFGRTKDQGSNSTPPVYALSSSSSTVNEGSSVTFTLNTTAVFPQTLYWTTNVVSGTINASDFSDSATSGSFELSGNFVSSTGSFSRTFTSDKTTEGTESFQIQIRTGSTSGTIIATSGTITVSDTSQTPTYAVSPSTTSVNEGSSVTLSVTTTDVDDGTTLYWTTNVVSGTINASDFSDSATSGSFTINGGSGSFSRTISSDATTEGSESFQIEIRTGSTSGTIVATTSTITINDTSLDPTYAVSPSTSSVNEGSTVTFTVTTTDVPNGTTLYWTTNVVSGTVNSSDFTDASTSGSFAISSGSGTISRTIANDATTEGSESFQIQIRLGSTSGTIVATSSTVTINDTSVTPFSATGGNTVSTTSRSGYKVHTFTGPGSFVVATNSKNVEVLIVGGGGSGGKAPSFQSGGGGAGALIYKSSVPATPGTYPIIIGQGGTGGTSDNPGQATTAFGYSAAGGGRGGSEWPGGNISAGSGGSGGGGQWTTPSGGSTTANTGGTNNSGSPNSGWGNPGGSGSGSGGTGCNYSGAGGGGAGGKAPNTGTGAGGPGGPGLSYSITGSSVAYAGGGAGSWRCGGTWTGGSGGGGNSYANGTANTGGGGGAQGGSGGSGVVIIAYPTA